MKALPIGPEEAFVLSRVDGRTSEQEIAAVTGLAATRVSQVLARLAELGAVNFDVPLPPPERPARPEPGLSSGRRMRPAVEASEFAGPTSLHPAAALYDPAELDEAVDLELQRKRQILDHFYRLESVTHYELLGVDAHAEKKAIKDAYFKLVGSFHPDRYFGKKLGSFKPKLERVFQRLTEAHDTLTRAKSRAEYDAYLATQSKTATMERALGDERSRAAQVEHARRVIEEEARVAERAQHTPGRPVRRLSEEERRRALARKLGAATMPPRTAAAPPPSARSPQVQEMVADELKRRYEDRLERAREGQIRKYREAADEAIANKDILSAANALRIAASLNPDDKGLADEVAEVQERANQELSETYLDQARYEERSGRFREAAQSYERAARGKPSAALFERAAHCLLEAEGDMRRAGDLAKKAVNLAPKSPEPRVTLARVYVRAGMKESALLEFERAAQLSPTDDTIKDWIKRLKRGEV
ncbi:MAG: DnaJ domain-containing protein [Polyangiaceae bacterium]